MTRYELLENANNTGKLSRTAYWLAKQTQSPAQLSTMSENIEGAYARISIGVNVAMLVMLLLAIIELAVIVGGSFSVFWGTGDIAHLVRSYVDDERFLMSFMVVLILDFTIICWLKGLKLAYAARRAYLTPVVNTKVCLQAATYLKTQIPEVLAWRDLALAEREVLAEFDVEVMRALVAFAKKEAEPSDIQAACRSLYGIGEGQ